MKKILLGTSALIGAAAMASSAFAGEAKVTISGTVEFQYSYTDQDNGVDAGDIRSDSSNTALFVNAAYTADNGLNYGAHIDYRVAASAVDEAYIWFNGDWGRVHFGDDDGALSNLAVGGEGALAATGGFDGNAYDNITLPTGFNFGTASGAGVAAVTPSTAGGNGDASKIVYYTPSFSGFSGAVSWTPNNGGGNSGADNNEENTFEIAAQYSGNFDAVGIALNAGYRSADSNANNVEDVSAYELGASVSFAGFTLAAGYGDSGDSGAVSGSGNDDSDFWNVGLGYNFGAGSVGVGYFESQAETAAGDNEFDMVTVGGTYNVATGLTAFAEVNFLNFDQAGAGADTDATRFILGSRVTF